VKSSFDVVELIDLLDDFFLLFFEDLLEILFVLLLLLLDQLLQLFEFLADELLVYLVGLLNPGLVALADD
jgi:hypothetical protein